MINKVDFQDFKNDFLAMKEELKSSFGITEDNQQIQVTPQEILGYTLYPVQEQWVDFCFSLDALTSMLLASRHYGKTDIIVIYKIIDILMKEPNKTFLVATKEFSRAKDIVNTVGNFLQHKYKKKGKFTETTIQLNENKFKKQPNIKAITPNASSLKGNHVDYLIGDDIVGAKDEKSEAKLQQAIDFYDEAISAANKIIILGQPVDENDLYSHLQKEEFGTQIFYSPHGTIPELDKDLDTFRKNGVTERTIQKNYHLVLVPDEKSPFANLDVRTFAFNQDTRTIAVIDPAFGGGDSIGFAIGFKNTKDKYFVKVKDFGKSDIYTKIDEILKHCVSNNCFKLFIESIDNGGVYRAFKQRSRELKINGLLIKGFKDFNNKDARMLYRISKIKNDLYLDGDTNEVTSWYVKKKENDVIDALASLINFLDRNKEGVKITHG